MSKIALSSPASGSATFTIAAPVGSTDRTLTLPDASGTVATTADIPAAPTIASTAAAQAGTNNTNFITPLRMREGFNASGSAPVYACRAWVNFNGTTSPGTIRASGNVSSVTRNGTGDYTVNFTTAMPDANYVLNGTCNVNTTGDYNRVVGFPYISAPTTSAARISTSIAHTAAIENQSFVSVAIFR